MTEQPCLIYMYSAQILLTVLKWLWFLIAQVHFGQGVSYIMHVLFHAKVC